MKTFEQLRDAVNAALPHLDSLQGEPSGLYEPALYTLEGGGKRLRPVMALMACQLFRDDISEALQPALGLEVFHNFTLLHDDVMDHADKRRGRPTVHVRWNTNTAILSGDAMFAVAVSLVSRCRQEVLPRVMDAFTRLAVGVCEGQQYDMEFETSPEVSMEAYMEMIRLKTAVLLAGALEIGAIVGGGAAPAIQSLYDYGTQIGLAFQLQDDLLDLYGDEAKFGKKIGSDIRENKKTWLYIKALELLGEQDAARLRGLFRTPTTPANEADKIGEVRALYEKAEVKACVEAEIERLFGAGEAALSLLSSIEPAPRPEALKILRNFTASLLQRDY